MGCACGKPGDVAMVGYKNPKTTLYFGVSSNLNTSSSHIRITNLTVNKKPDVYLGALEEKINITRKTYTYKPNDYLQILQELRALFFQYLDQRTVLQDDRGRPVSARYRKAMDWRLYENFEREFASELYRRRHEQITRQELYDLFETYIQRTHINLRPEHLQTDGHDDRREYIGQILIIPSTSTTNKVGNYVINKNDDDSSSSSSESESRSSKTKESANHAKGRRLSVCSRISSSSSSDSNSEMISGGAKKQIAVTTRMQSRNSRSSSSSSSDSNSETELTSDKKQGAVVRFKEDANTSSSSISSGTESSKAQDSTEQVVDYELMLEGEFQRISGEGISADEYILLLLLYSQALQELRNQQQGQDKETVISNFKNNFLTRRIMIEQLKETRQKKENESRIPDTKGYTEAADKELKENEDNMKKVIETNSNETEIGDSQSNREKQLLDFINKQTALIQKLEEERENEIKQLEAEIAATQTTDTSTDDSEIVGDDTDKSEDQSRREEQKQIEKAMDKNHKKLKKAIIEDPSDKKKIKKKLKKIRKKLKETMEEVDGNRLKRLETIEEENVDLPDDVEDTESYGNLADKELIRDNELLLENIKRLRVVREQDMEEFEKQKKDLNDRLENETKLMLQMEDKRNERLEQTQTDLIDRKLKEMNQICLKDILEDVTDDERIKRILDQHRKDQTNLATEVDSNRLRQRELLKQRLRDLREKQGISAEDENETSMFDMIRSTDDFSTDFDKELETEMDELLVTLKDIDGSDSDSSEKRRNIIEQHLDQVENTFKRLNSDRNDIVNNIKRSTNAEEELVNDLNSEFVKTIEESLDTCDEEMAGRKLQEHRLRQRKLLEDMDSDRIQKRNLLALKLRQMKTKPAVEDQDQTQAATVMETGKYLEAIDKELQCNEEDLIEFLTKDTSDINEDNREKEITDKLEDFVSRQKQLVGRYESERREKILEAAKGPTIDVPSNLNEMNGWLKRSLFNGNTPSEEDVQDKLAEYRNKQKKLLEDVDSKRLQQKKILQLKLKKLREEKELKDAENTSQNTDADNLIQDIATITGTDQEIAEEDKEFVKSIYTQKENNTLSDDEVQKRILEHFSKKRKMKDLLDEENKSCKNQIQERKESIKKKRAEEEEKRRIQEEEEQTKQEEQEEEHRKALSRAYRNNEMVKSSSLIRKHQADQARMAVVVEESKSKVKDQIKEKKKRKMQQENGYGAEQS